MMKIEGKNILFTGPPGCGKSTLIEKIIRHSKGPCTGFFTREMREQGRRVGFAILTLDGKQGILAHQNIKSPYRVGKYGVNLEDIDRIAVPSIIPAGEDAMVVVDEIGKMECFSPLFRITLIQILDSENPVVGSISFKGNQFIRHIKRRTDIQLVQVSEMNRDMLVGELFNL